MTVNVRFYNKTKEDSDFENRFSFFYDFPANSLLESVKSQAHEVIFERLTKTSLTLRWPIGKPMTMNAQTYLNLLARPGSLSEQELGDLRTLTERFSYLQGAWTLRWLNTTDEVEKQESLLRAATLTYDRLILLRLQRDPSIVLDNETPESAQAAFIDEEEELGGGRARRG